jgi:hypothetical protein
MGEIERKITGLLCESSLIITVSIVARGIVWYLNWACLLSKRIRRWLVNITSVTRELKFTLCVVRIMDSSRFKYGFPIVPQFLL